MLLFSSKLYIDLIVGYSKRVKHKNLTAKRENVLLYKEFEKRIIKCEPISLSAV